MANVPSPLQAGSPVATRKPSVDTVPTALQAGSPVTGPTTRPPLTRKNTSGGSDRLSQLFPSRPPSVVSVATPTSTTTSRRTSLPTPLIPAAEPSYRVPRPPAPPTFPEDTSYSASAYAPQGASPSIQRSSGTRRLLSRLSSLSSGHGKGSKYNKLEDEESGSYNRGLRGVQEEDEAIGLDLSGLDGLPLRNFEPGKKIASAADARERERHMSEAGLAAEYERLEAQLGSGMSSVIEKPFTHSPGIPRQGTVSNHKRGLSGSDLVTVQAQEEAEKSGGIVAVADVPVDISDFHAGTDFDARSVMTADTGLAKDEAQTSYFFPTGMSIKLC